MRGCCIRTPVMKYNDEIRVARSAVSRAAAVCRKVHNRIEGVMALEKEDRSPVTVADFGSQAIITMVLLQAFPDDMIVGEEGSDELKKSSDVLQQVLALVTSDMPGATRSDVIDAVDRSSGAADFGRRCWAVDPIDGTRGFLRGDQYAIALALVDSGRVVLGVLGCPRFNEGSGRGTEHSGSIVYAVEGQGACIEMIATGQKKAVSVDCIKDPCEARFCESVERAHASHEVHARITAALGIGSAPCRIDSQAKYAAVACGRASLYLRLPRSSNYREKIWDHAAGEIIVREAGGSVTDFRGNALDFTAGKTLEKNYGILASNGHLHDKALEVIDRIISEKT